MKQLKQNRLLCTILFCTLLSNAVYSQDSVAILKGHYVYLAGDVGLGFGKEVLVFGAALSGGYQFTPYLGFGVSGNTNYGVGYGLKGFKGFALNYRAVVLNRFVLTPYFGKTTKSFYTTDCLRCTQSGIDKKKYPYFGMKILFRNKSFTVGLTHERSYFTLREVYYPTENKPPSTTIVKSSFYLLNLDFLIRVKHKKSVYYFQEI